MAINRLLSRRSSGLLLHPTSLPGPHGAGDLGPCAYQFADFLAESGQSLWQMLPVGPTGPGNSPYSSPSSFAGNPWLISLELMAREGFLDEADIVGAPAFPPGRADYRAAAHYKEPRLRQAFSRFMSRATSEHWDAFRAFYNKNHDWVDEYSLFCALKEKHGGAPWVDWEPMFRKREFRNWGQDALRNLFESATYHQFLQFLFDRQWQALRCYAASRGVRLIGDVPIYAAHESADVWACQEVFHLGADGRPSLMAGVPPDYFSQTGQLWGNPLYRWDELARRGYDWWIARLKIAARRFDAVRLDHFIGFQRYWEIPASAKTAKEGRWVPGPQAAFFEKALPQLPELELIAEDLGCLTTEVSALRDRFGLPGMRVLQFAFGADEQAENFLPPRYPERCVAYTGTHDNDTVVGWFNDDGSGPGSRSPEQARKERAEALRYLGGDGREIHWDMIAAVFKSTANTAIVPVQDVLGLGGEARMNYPGVAEGNWEWRLLPGQLGQAAAGRLRALAEASERVARQAQEA
ncbi:MAG: 4-alpha-glucanotransferase [Elusimicrobia bacterium]|nr:4-alpha-glucanotransferase [Elusimicrobiota bacterium]